MTTNDNLPNRYSRKLLPWLSVIVLFGVGIGLGWYLQRFAISTKKDELTSAAAIREHKEGFNFIAPLLLAGDLPALRSFNQLETRVDDLITASVREGQIGSAAVYFRDLTSGQWFGVDEDEKYAPASMYKVALLITYLRGAETDPSLLETKIIYDVLPEERVAVAEIDSPKIELGKPYTINELLQRMIIYSDNDAKGILENIVVPDAKKDVFTDLNLSLPEPDDSGDTMSPKSISLFFRILYNSSYLSDGMSEYALELMSKAAFKSGLVAGVPTEVVVAHKYGHRPPSTASQPIDEELHDCGIVYHSRHPYFLCVMTKGSDLENLKKIIQTISKTVYQAVNADYQ